MDTIPERIKVVKSWAMKNLKGKSIYCPVLQSDIYFGEQGIKHAIYYKTSLLKLKILQNIEKYIRVAKKRDVQIDKNNPKRKIFRLRLIANIEKQKHLIYIVIKENKKGKYYYDSGKIKKV